MTRHDFVTAIVGESALAEHLRGRRGDYYAEAPDRVSLSDWYSMCSGYAVVDLGTERQEPPPPAASIIASCAKRLFLEARQPLVSGQPQPTWERIQRQGDMDSEPPARLAAAAPWRGWRLSAETRTVLEEFEGFVDQIDGEVAYITLTPTSGEPLYGEYPAAELRAKGIHERRRFKCRTIEAGRHISFEVEPIPDLEVSKERERAIEEELRKLLGDDDGTQHN